MKKAPQRLTPLTEGQIMEKWIDKELKVTIICPTYNHEEFIEDALCGFLAQKTNFPFEVIVRDDASTDQTAEIIRKYAERYPKIIKPILETVNKYPNVQPGPVLRSLAKGKYLAYCEGDDYWIDSLKLQKQVDYLENNPDTSLLETQSVAIENGFIINWPGSGGTRTYMHPSKIEIPSKYYHHIYFGDTYIRAILQAHGKVEKIDDITAVWRKHEGGIFGSTNAQKDTAELNFKRATTNFWIAVYYSTQNKPKASFDHFRVTVNQLLDAYPYETTYSTRLKLASYLIAHPLMPLLSSIKKKVRRIL